MKNLIWCIRQTFVSKYFLSSLNFVFFNASKFGFAVKNYFSIYVLIVGQIWCVGWILRHSNDSHIMRMKNETKKQKKFAKNTSIKNTSLDQIVLPPKMSKTRSEYALWCCHVLYIELGYYTQLQFKVVWDKGYHFNFTYWRNPIATCDKIYGIECHMHICMQNLKSLKAASKYYLSILNSKFLLFELMQL